MSRAAQPVCEERRLGVPGAELALRCHWVDEEPRPTILLRTPYGAQHHDREAAHWAELGFHCVFADVRGRYASTGEFVPYTREGEDGELVARHVLADSHVNGQLIAYGASYAAHCALELARRVPLAGLILLVPSLSLGCATNDGPGIYRLLSHTWWWHRHARARTPREEVTLERLLADDAAILRRPLGSIPGALGLDVPGWSEAWEAPHTWELPAQAAALPLLLCSGFHDAYVEDTARLASAWPGPCWCMIGHTDHSFRDPHGRRAPWIGAALTEWGRALRDAENPQAAEALGRRYELQDQEGAWHRPAGDGAQCRSPQACVRACVNWGGERGAERRGVMRPGSGEAPFPSWQIPSSATAGDRLRHQEQCSAVIEWPEEAQTGVLCGRVTVSTRVEVAGPVEEPGPVTTFAHLLCVEGTSVRWVASTSLTHEEGEVEFCFPAVCARLSPGQTWIIQWSMSDEPVHRLAGNAAGAAAAPAAPPPGRMLSEVSVCAELAAEYAAELAAEGRTETW